MEQYALCICYKTIMSKWYLAINYTAISSPTPHILINLYLSSRQKCDGESCTHLHHYFKGNIVVDCTHGKTSQQTYLYNIERSFYHSFFKEHMWKRRVKKPQQIWNCSINSVNTRMNYWWGFQINSFAIHCQHFWMLETLGFKQTFWLHGKHHHTFIWMKCSILYTTKFHICFFLHFVQKSFMRVMPKDINPGKKTILSLEVTAVDIIRQMLRTFYNSSMPTILKGIHGII